ncbi:hypothetical protein HDR58_01775 [bacterium]|nr:hypothetical protein [bacterium]
MKEVLKAYEDLESGYVKLYNYIQTMTVAMLECADSNGDVSCLNELQSVIKEQSIELFDSLDCLNTQLYKKI